MQEKVFALGDAPRFFTAQAVEIGLDGVGMPLFRSRAWIVSQAGLEGLLPKDFHDLPFRGRDFRNAVHRRIIS